MFDSMKSLFNFLLILFAATFSLSSCEKEETNFRVASKAQIIFDDNIDKVTADYTKAGNLALKISADGANSVKVTSQYTASGVAKEQNLGTLAVSNGVASLNVPAVSVRNTADGLVVGAGSNPTSSRATNTYILKVDAIIADGSTETRYFTAVIVQ
jgi:hypothetical protein